MATNAYKSTAVTNLETPPAVRGNSWVHGGGLKSYASTIEGSGADSIGSTFRHFRVKSNFRPHELRYASDAGGTSAKVDIGIYRTSADGGAAVHTSCLASAVSIATATPLTHVLFTSANGTSATGIANVEKRLWELAGLSTDPNVNYDIVATVVDDVDNAATHSMTGTFSQ